MTPLNRCGGSGVLTPVRMDQFAPVRRKKLRAQEVAAVTFPLRWEWVSLRLCRGLKTCPYCPKRRGDWGLLKRHWLENKCLGFDKEDFDRSTWEEIMEVNLAEKEQRAWEAKQKNGTHMNKARITGE